MNRRNKDPWYKWPVIIFIGATSIVWIPALVLLTIGAMVYKKSTGEI